MDGRWTPVLGNVLRDAKVILHRTSSIREVRNGAVGVDLTDLASEVKHSFFEATVKLKWNRSLFGVANQPKANQILELKMLQDGVYQSIWIGVISNLRSYTISRGEREMQLIARSRGTMDIFQNVKRVTQIFPQMTDIGHIIRKVANATGLNNDEIILAPSGFATSHTNTQLADMSAWEMFEVLMLPLGWTPYIDGLGRLRAASRDLNRPPDTILVPRQIKRVAAENQIPPVTRVRVKWLDPVLKKSAQQGRKLNELVITVGWWRPVYTVEKFFSDDKTLRAENTRIVIRQSANTTFINFIDENPDRIWTQTGENVGELRLVNRSFAPILASLATWTLASQSNDEVITDPLSGEGVTVPTGRRVQASAQLAFMLLMMCIGTGIYEIWGTPYEWIYARNTTEAFDEDSPNWVDKNEDIESDFIANELHAQAVAVRELLYRYKSTNKWRVELADDPRLEYGDIVQFPDTSKMFIEDVSRTLTRGSSAVVVLTGFLIGSDLGAAGEVIIGSPSDDDALSPDPEETEGEDPEEPVDPGEDPGGEEDPPVEEDPPSGGGDATLWVNAITGDDSRSKATVAASGGSLPWATIGRAAWGSTNRLSPNSAEAASAGDTVSIASGTYNYTGAPINDNWDLIYNPVNNGTTGNPITFRAEGVVTLTATTTASPVIGCDGRDYIVWEGHFLLDEVNILTTPDSGVCVVHDTIGSIIDGAEIDGNTVGRWDDNHCGIRLEAAVNCVVRNCTIYAVYEEDPGHNGCGVMTYDSINCVIEHNHIFDCGSGVFLKGAAVEQRGMVVRYNLIEDCEEGIIAHVASESRIYQNIVDSCNHAFLIHQFDSSQGPTDSWIFNNLAINCTNVGIYWRGAVTSLIAARSYNNIVVDCGYATYADANGLPSGCDAEHNVYFSNTNFFESGNGSESFTTYKTNYGEDAVSPASIEGQDPLFVNRGAGNYRLQTGSPARTIGSAIYGVGGADGTIIPAGPYVTGSETIGPE